MYCSVSGRQQKRGKAFCNIHLVYEVVEWRWVPALSPMRCQLASVLCSGKHEVPHKSAQAFVKRTPEVNFNIRFVISIYRIY